MVNKFYLKLISILLCLSMLSSMLPMSIYGTDIENTEIIITDESTENICTECGSSEEHLESCSQYIGDNKIENECSCNSVYDIHDDTCPLYIIEDNMEDETIECSCEYIDSIHSSDCPLYEEVPECICGENVEVLFS